MNMNDALEDLRRDAVLGSSPGDRLRFVHPTGGYPLQQEHAAKHLTVGASYTIRHLEVGSWSSRVCFEELPGEWFNTVLFEVAA